MENFKDRVVSLWPNTSIKEIADTIGMTDISLHRLFKENRLPKADSLLNIHNKTGCDLKWLMTGEGSSLPNGPTKREIDAESANIQAHTVTDTQGNRVSLDDFVFIPRYDLCASAGNGFNADEEQMMHTVAFRKFWVTNYINAKPSDLSCISVKGDSMEGVLNDKDLILVNHAKNSPGNGLYVLRMGSDLIVKRTQTMPGSKLLVTSANEAYASFEIDFSLLEDDISIIGKVEWYGRQL